MAIAYPLQNLQDWFTQQWVILWGRKIAPNEFDWLIGPFGELNGIGQEFVEQLATREGLTVERGRRSQGLIPSFAQLDLSEQDLSRLSQSIIDFYEKTSEFDLELNVNWNPFFKIFGILVNRLFSNRINQLNIPTENIDNAKSLISEIITLSDPQTNEIKYTVWFRTFRSSGKVVYSGIYSTCKLPSGKTCIKAIFPLPKGNATVIMTPSVGANGELILDSSGKRFSDAGFYFLLNDSKGNYWAQFIRSFRDRLTLHTKNDGIMAEQTLTLWGLRVAIFTYEIRRKE